MWRLNAPRVPYLDRAELLNELHEDLIALDPDYRLEQVKEKFGALRFYATFREPVSRQCQALVAEAERRSREICERCGEPGEVRTDRSRWLTLCDDCDLAV